MDRILSHTPLVSRQHSRSSQKSTLSSLGSTWGEREGHRGGHDDDDDDNEGGHGGGDGRGRGSVPDSTATGGGGSTSTSHAPHGGDAQPHSHSGEKDKPHTFGDIAHRAIGDHVPTHAHHDRQGGGDGLHERFDSGGDHPGLDRNQESGHFSHGMPGSGLTKGRKEELDRAKDKGLADEKNDGPGSLASDPKGAEQGLGRMGEKEKEDPAYRKAAGALKQAVGGDLAGGKSRDDGDGDHDRQDDRKDTDLTGHSAGRRIGREEMEQREVDRATRTLEAHARDHADQHHPSAHAKERLSVAQESQRRWLDPDGVPPRQPEGQDLSYPYTGHRPEHAYHGKSKQETMDREGEREVPTHGGSDGDARVHGNRDDENHAEEDARDPEEQRNNMTDEEKEQDDRERLPKQDRRPAENGQVPDVLPGSKREERPGPRNEINLKPRVPKIRYHTVDAPDLHKKAGNVLLEVSADGETEDLPSGSTWRHAPDPEDKLTSTREKERRLLGLKKQPDDDENAEYDDERMLRGDHIGPNDKHGPLVDGDRRYDYGEEEEDAASSSDDGVSSSSDEERLRNEEGQDHVGSMDKGAARRTSRPGRPDHPVEERIPKADPTRQNELMSANESPASKRPKNQRIWSTFRRKGGDQHSGPFEAPAQGTSAAGARPGTSTNGSRAPSTVELQGPLDAEKTIDEPKSTGQQKWTVLRAKLLHRQTANMEKQSSPAQIPVTTELLAGQLPAMILKTWLDRDEHGARTVPVLLGSLKFRVGDSAGFAGNKDGQQTGREVFRIECEYGDGAVKWVIYRELRDFVSLHTHYKADNLGTRVSHIRGARRIEIPEFPKTSIPYLNKFRRLEGKLDGETAEKEAKEIDMTRKDKSKQEASRESRAVLQQYLVELIRAVMFRSEANRLCRFFELSSLTLALAPRGGFQGKAGFLRILGNNASKRANQPGLLPSSWKHAREPKWWIVRESYFVATDGPESTDYYDVFLIDPDFTIERPKRKLRQGLKKLTGQGSLKAAIGYNAKEGEGNHTSAEDKNLHEIAAAAGSGQALTKEQQKKLSQHSQALGEGDSRDASQHTFYINSSQRRLKLVAKNVRQMQQFIVSMERVAAQSVWGGRNRFDSFAPIRMNVAAQWLVDGRDYYWNLSRALNMAKETVYIHDWWISPELYLRRPGNERYRLDNLLKRKAEEGVKIFIIIYNEVSDKTTPTDSTYAKKRLMSLHPNIMVQRSPSHFQTGTFYWSHHEKLCVIDEAIAFMGGLDLCYGRWDTSQHVLVDDDFEPGAVGENGPIWPGKDMANERVVEFHTLNKPFEDMFDRTKVPRMPWHDVGLQIVGQPARDLCRHFIQRWNHLIRTKNHKRPMPFLLPPADFTEMELKSFGLQGTCEIQICRSCGPWSMGTPTTLEHSIQNAYLKAIQLSDHFVYIENQFFITSTVVDGVEIKNRIGDAIVDRIIRAHKEETPWKACIMIPLLPGYTFPIDTAEASSVRLILECQNRTISRGAQSIFSRLKKEGIDPNEYISFFALRGWGKFKSGALTTEQVYIHGKTMVVDDRLVICGSANINERSQSGDRDSELAAVIRDTDMIDSTMAGKPYKVGRFAHSLRMRLMREHVGVDVDAIEEDQLMDRDPIAHEDHLQKWDPDHEQNEGENVPGRTSVKHRHARDRLLMTIQSGAGAVTKGMSENAISNVKKAANVVIKPAAILSQHNTVATSGAPKGDPSERQDYDRDGELTAGFASSVMPTLEERTIFERRPSAGHANGQPLFDALDEQNKKGEGHDIPEAKITTKEREQFEDKAIDEVENPKDGSGKAPVIAGPANEQDKFGVPANADAEDKEVPNKDTERHTETDEDRLAVKARSTLRKHLSAKVGTSPWTMPTPTPIIEADKFADPLLDSFWKDMWIATAVHNTEIYRKVFRCIPDDLVTSWASYKAFANHAEKFNKVPTDITPDDHEPTKVTHDGPGTHGAGGGGSGGGIVGQEGVGPNEGAATRQSDIVNGHPLDRLKSNGSSNSSASSLHHILDPTEGPVGSGHRHTASRATDGPQKREGHGSGGGGSGGGNVEGKNKRPSGPNEAWQEWEKEEMEILLEEIRGHLVVYPTRFLESEDAANNFLFNSDKILPLPIFD